MTTPSIDIIQTQAELDALRSRLERASVLALDVEGNGLYAYKSKLCTVQLAWHEGQDLVVAIVDTLAVDVAPLGHPLGPTGPVKLLHDLSFDARMLAEAHAPLANVRDTSVAARLLGYKATGLASLAEAELGLTLTKRFQQHDWAARPLTAEHLEYLAGDVLHLFALDARLMELARAKDLTREIVDECDYKLACSTLPPRDSRPGYVRMKGSAALDGLGRAVLRRLVEAREVLAERADRAPFRVVSNEVLLELARTRPTTEAAVRRTHGLGHAPAGRHARAWMEAIRQGLADARIPAEDEVYFARPTVDREAIARRRSREGQLNAWRRREATRREVDEQAILPGHCAQALLQLALAPEVEREALRRSIATVDGFGARRTELYADTLATLLTSPLSAAAPAEPADAASCPPTSSS